MPLITYESRVMPGWCEMTHYEIVRLRPGDTHTFAPIGPKEKLIVGEGRCRIAYGGKAVDAEQGANLDLARAGAQFEVTAVHVDTVLVRMAGHWGDELGGSGVFFSGKSSAPEDRGDPVDYPKETDFDNHYHDCDEYWILWAGRGTVVSEGKSYEVGPGDCVATGMGHHHDFPVIAEPVRAVYFETTLQGEKRRGHLWNHTHGPAQPQMDRV